LLAQNYFLKFINIFSSGFSSFLGFLSNNKFSSKRQLIDTVNYLNYIIIKNKNIKINVIFSKKIINF